MRLIIVGHTDQLNEFNKLQKYFKTGELSRFLNIGDFIDRKEIVPEISSDIFIDRYVTCSVQHGILPTEINKMQQVNYIHKLNNSIKNILSEIELFKPDLVLLEKNNYVGKSIAKKLDIMGVLNGIFLPLRYNNDYMYFERGALNKPLIINQNNDVEIFPDEVDYLKLHRTDIGLSHYLKKRKYYRQTFDYRLHLLNRNFSSRLTGMLLRLLAKYQYDQIKVEPGHGWYIYLHHQPELALEDCKREWMNQISKIEELRMRIPFDQKLYVKESPSMLYRRGLDDYRRIHSLPNTFLLDSSIKNEDVFKKAKVILTVSGTIALESVMNSVPALIFHKTWFSNCPGIKVVDSVEDLPIDLNTLNFSQDQSKIFLKQIAKKIAIKGKVLFLGRRNVTNTDIEEYVIALREVFKKEILNA